MKKSFLVQVGLLAVLVITAASCGLPMGATSEYYEDAPARGNIYYGSPYYGSPNAIIVERDPFTGRYYEVSPRVYRNNVYARPAYPTRRYNNNRNYDNRNTNSGRTNGYYRTTPQTQRPQQAPAPSPQVKQQRQQAKESILGRKQN
jgi:hypothetical protein